MNIKGFTLLEVTLFLAISGALGLIAFVGLGPRLRNLRFTQSVRLAENTINNQFNASTSGQNVRPANFSCSIGPSGLVINTSTSTTTGSSPDCVINGKMVFFENDKMTFYSIVSRRVAQASGSVDCNSASSLSDIITCFTPRITGVIQGQPPESTEVTYSSGVKAELPTVSPNGYGYIQSPNGVEKYPFFFQGAKASLVASPDINSGNAVAAGPLPVCLQLSNRKAEITFDGKAIKPKVSFEGCTI